MASKLRQEIDSGFRITKREQRKLEHIGKRNQQTKKLRKQQKQKRTNLLPPKRTKKMIPLVKIVQQYFSVVKVIDV